MAHDFQQLLLGVAAQHQHHLVTRHVLNGRREHGCSQKSAGTPSYRPVCGQR
jgi:hypothetical protein